MEVPTLFLVSNGPGTYFGQGLEPSEAKVTPFVSSTGRVVQDVVNLSQRAASLLDGRGGATFFEGSAGGLRLAPLPPFVVGGRAVNDVIDLSEKVLRMFGSGRPGDGDGFSVTAEATPAVPKSTVTGLNEPASGIYLAGLDYQYNRLAGANFYWSTLDDANFKGADLTNARFDSASLENTSFVRSSLRGATFHYANVTDANFTAADLRGADLSNASGLTAAQLRYAVLDETTRLPTELQYLAISVS